MDNLNLLDILACILHKGLHNILVSKNMIQHHFVHGKLHLLHKEKEYKVLLVLQVLFL